MVEVANINGIPVFSDKEMESIINTKITFKDGSWCDTLTGEVVNNGKGTIKIGGEMPNTSKTEGKKEYSHNGNSLEITNINSDISIETHSNKNVLINVTGPEKDISNIKVSESNGVISVSDNSSTSKRKKGGINISRNSIHIGSNVVVSGNSIIQSGGNTTIISSGSKSSISIQIKVPKGFSINSNDVTGNMNIGNIYGPVSLSTSSGDIKVGSVTNAQLSIQGGGDITVKSVNGDLLMTVQGSGDIKVEKGYAPNVNASIQGSGDIKFKGKADNANLSIMSSGDIEINYVKNRPITNIAGNGDIEIGNW